MNAIKIIMISMLCALANRYAKPDFSNAIGKLSSTKGSD